MKLTTKAKQIEMQIRALLKELKKDICDEYLDPDSDSTVPQMQVTFSTKDFTTWSYQTGDNSFTGSCYGDPFWSVVWLSRRDNTKKLGAQVVDELMDQYLENIVEKVMA